MLMSSVLRLSMVSLIPLLTELLSSQLPRQTHPEHQNLPLRQLTLLVPTYARHPQAPFASSGWWCQHTHTIPEAPCVMKPQTKLFASDVTHLHGSSHSCCFGLAAGSSG